MTDIQPHMDQLYASAQARHLAGGAERWAVVRNELMRRTLGEELWTRIYGPSAAPPGIVLAVFWAISTTLILGVGHAAGSTAVFLVSVVFVLVVGVIVLGLIWHERRHRDVGGDEDDERVAAVDEVVSFLNPDHLHPDTDAADEPTIEQQLGAMVGESLNHLRLDEATVDEAFDLGHDLLEISQARSATQQPHAWAAIGQLRTKDVDRQARLDQQSWALAHRVAALALRANHAATTPRLALPAADAARAVPPRPAGGRGKHLAKELAHE